MSAPISVLIADDNNELCDLISESINSTGDMRVIATAGDGKTAVELIRELKPDVVLLDIIMPKLDGLGVLESMARWENVRRPVIIASTSVGSESIIIRAMELGADYYIMKPFEVSILITRIRQVYSEKMAFNRYLAGPSGRRRHNRTQIKGEVSARQSRDDAVQTVTELINSIGVTPNLAGYNYLREAVLSGMEQPERLANVSRHIYTMLAEKYSTKVRNIDRAIRCALLSAQKKTKNANGLMQEMHESITINNGKRMNNSQVIAYLAKKAGSRLAETKSRLYRGI